MYLQIWLATNCSNPYLHSKMQQQAIPLHNFTQDDATSIPFRYLALELKNDHDASVPHRHNYYEIFVFKQGGGTHEIDFETYPIEHNSIHFVSPGQVHHVKRSVGSFGHIIFFSRDFFLVSPQQQALLSELSFVNNNGALPVIQFTPSEMQGLQPILQALQNESTHRVDYYEEAIRQYLSLLLIECRRRAPEAIIQTPSAEAQLCREFKNLLEKHFTVQHKVQYYAQVLNSTPKALNQALTKYTGNTASTLIFNRLTLEAKRLLRHSTLSVKEIAYFLNYDDPAHFSKFFKAQTSVSPAEYRDA